MKIETAKTWRLFVAAALVATTVIAASGTARAGTTATPAEDDSENGGKLWSEHCGQCHNKRSPEKFSDGQWEAVVLHMRVRANLTGTETRAITDFLKSAN